MGPSTPGIVLATGCILLTLLLVGLILPIWGIVDVAVSREKPSSSKVLWILGILLTWGGAALLYGIFGTGDRRLKRVSGLGLAGAVVSVLGFLWMLNGFLKLGSTVVKQVIPLAEQAATPGLSPEQKSAFMDSLNILQKESRRLVFSKDRARVPYTLAEEALTRLQDRTLTPEEYASWMDLFHRRDSVKVSDFERPATDVSVPPGLDSPALPSKEKLQVLNVSLERARTDLTKAADTLQKTAATATAPPPPPTAKLALNRFLKDPDWMVRRDTAVALARAGTRKDLAALKTVAQKDPRPEVREAASKAIQSISKRKGRS